MKLTKNTQKNVIDLLETKKIILIIYQGFNLMLSREI